MNGKATLQPAETTGWRGHPPAVVKTLKPCSVLRFLTCMWHLQLRFAHMHAIGCAVRTLSVRKNDRMGAESFNRTWHSHAQWDFSSSSLHVFRKPSSYIPRSIYEVLISLFLCALDCFYKDFWLHFGNRSIAPQNPQSKHVCPRNERS